MVNKLQAEVSDYKARLTKLEEEVSSLKKHKVEKPINEIVSTIPEGTGQPRKRGRPSKKSSTSINAFLHESQIAHGRKPILSKPQFEIKSPIFKTVVLKKVENNEISTHSTKCIGNTSNVNLERTYRTPSDDTPRNVLNATHQLGVNITHGRNFENEKNASEEQKDGIVGSTEDENEEETGDEEGTSSSA
jgi:hypothetical protein